MTTEITLESFLSRLARPAAIAAACLGVPSDLYHFTIDSRVDAADTFLFKVHGVLLVAAMLLLAVSLLGFAAGLGQRLGRSGLAATAIAFVGTVLVLANIATEAFAMPQAAVQLSDPEPYWLAVIVVSFGMFAAGWLAVAVIARRRSLVGLPAALVLGVGAVYAFGPLPGSYLLLLVGTAVVIGRGTAVSERARAETRAA